jgi:hypothetical protein
LELLASKKDGRIILIRARSKAISFLMLNDVNKAKLCGKIKMVQQIQIISVQQLRVSSNFVDAVVVNVVVPVAPMLLSPLLMLL